MKRHSLKTKMCWGKFYSGNCL